MKRVIVFVAVLAMLSSVCACGKKAKSESGTAGNDDSNNSVDSSIYAIIEEDVVDGGIDIDDIEDLPELELDDDFLEDDVSNSSSLSSDSSKDVSSDSGASSESIGSATSSNSKTSSGTSSKKTSSSTSSSSNTSSKNKNSSTTSSGSSTSSMNTGSTTSSSSDTSSETGSEVQKDSMKGWDPLS